jgi:type I restriction enzyme R subunit
LGGRTKATYKSSHSRDKLNYIGDYNNVWHELRPRIVNRFKNISKYQQKIKREGKVSTMRKTDCVIVVNMMLTGFDAKKVNTLYVDRRTNNTA